MSDVAVTATATINGKDHTGIPVVNPGDWFGQTWLIEIGGAVDSVYLIVEAGTAQDAIDELADSSDHGHHIHVPDDMVGDYDLETCYRGPRGQVIDLDWLAIHGQERADMPFPCRYFGEDLPAAGMLPPTYVYRQDAIDA